MIPTSFAMGIASFFFTVIHILLLSNLSMAVPASINRAAALEINRAGPYIGLIMADQTEEQTLLAAGVFLPCTKTPWLDFSGCSATLRPLEFCIKYFVKDKKLMSFPFPGRRFNIGSINGRKIIYVRCGQRRLNAGVSTQMLIYLFDIAGVVHYGTAGNANDSLSIGDVSIPKYFAYTGSWKWTKFGTTEVGDQFESLHFGNYDIPLGNKTNLLSNVIFQPEEFFSENSEIQEIFWLEATQKWFYTASKLEGLKLEGCVNSTFCLPEAPKVVVGLKASTADIFVDNAAFREFLFNHFQVASVDEESAAIAMICQSSSVPVIVFRGLSDLAGGDKENVSSMFSSLAAKNALTAALAFLSLLQNATEGGVSNALQFFDT